MRIEQFYLGCLAHASYLIADGGEAAVVDPRRDIGIYLDAAQRLGVQIRYVFLTHFHADFLAGHLELRERTGATICLGAVAKAEYAFRAFADGEELALGAGRLRVLHTPGHTPESITLLVFDPGAAQSKAALTGDTLFIGDVGRPDLRASLGWSAQALGELLYRSLQEKILPLPDATLIYPAHGAGSLCGKNISRETVSTLGEQRRLNYALQPMPQHEFLRLVLAGQPDAPAYFTFDAVLNARERPNLEVSLDQTLRPLEVAAAESALAQGAVLLDTRPPVEHARAYWRGAVNIPLDGSFATWCGTLLSPDTPIVVIATPGREREAGIRLGRIGFDRIAGYLEHGMEALAVRSDLLASRERVAPADLAALMASAAPSCILDVRTESECASGAIPSSLAIPLGQLPARRRELPASTPLVVYCQSGYRSSIAASLLQSWSYEARDLDGGYAAWRNLKLET